MKTEFEKKLYNETGLSIEDLPDRNEGYYDDFVTEDGDIDYDAIMND